MTNYSLECDRYGISDRAAAALANAIMTDLEIIDEKRTKNVIDKSKIRRERTRVRNQSVMEKNKDISGGIKCIGFDGKRDRKTKIQKSVIQNGKEKLVHEVGTEEHITYTSEPNEAGHSYLCHSTIAANQGTGRDLAKDFHEVIVAHNSETTIEAVVCDGTSVRKLILLSTID